MRQTIARFLLMTSGFGILSVLPVQVFAEQVSIRLNQVFRGGEIIGVRRELDRAGYRSTEYNLRSVTVVADGGGAVELRVNGRSEDWKRLREDGYRQRDGTFAVTLNNSRPWQSEGAWHIEFLGGTQMRVDWIVVDMDYRGGDHRPPPDRERVYSVRLESLFGGKLNGYWEAPEGEEIVDMRLARQHSNDPCTRGRSYNFNYREAGVSHGCRGTFDIYTRRYRW